jgi:hypothetical protein
MRSPVCLSIWAPPMITFEPIDFNEIRHGGNAIEGDIDAIIPNRQRMCSTAERKWRLYLQTLLVFTSSPGGRVEC